MEIRNLKKGEVSEVKKLCKNVHWSLTLQDIERLYHLEPDGWFCALVNGQYVGQAMGLRIESLGCVGIVIVHEGFRRKGIATALTKAALSYLIERGIKTIKLDATQEGYGIYEKMNFVPEFSVSHYVRKGISEAITFGKISGVERLKSTEIDKISEFDKKYFGVNRSKVLRALDRDSIGFVFKKLGTIQGYAMVRPMDTENGYWLGPWVAKNVYSAEGILNHILKDPHHKEILLGVPEPNLCAQDLLAKYGFKIDFKITRMYYGSKPKMEDPSGIFGEAGHEKG